MKMRSDRSDHNQLVTSHPPNSLQRLRMGATPLSPSSSQEIVPISPPIASSSKLKQELATTLPKAKSTFDPSPALKERIRQHVKDDKMVTQSPSPELRRAYKRAREADVKDVKERGKMSRSQQTERMVSHLPPFPPLQFPLPPSCSIVAMHDPWCRYG